MNITEHINKKFLVNPNKDVPPYVGRLKNTDRNNIYELFAELGYTHGAEIGVSRAINAVEMFKRIPDLKLILVDPWIPYTRSMTVKRANRHYQIAKEKMKSRNAVIMRMTSMEAVKQIKDSSLDFIYIDGLHNFDNVMLDLIHWSPKVKTNGIISGHDYCLNAGTGVFKAVSAYASGHGVYNIYMTKESPQSFFWVKNKKADASNRLKNLKQI